MKFPLLRHLLCVLALLCFLGSFLLLTSCATGKGDGWSYSSFATDTEGLDVSAQGMKAQKINQSVAFGKATSAFLSSWKSYLLNKGFTYMAGKYYDAKGAEVSAKQAVDLEKLRNAKSSNDAAAALERLRVGGALEAAAPVAGAPAAALGAVPAG